MNSRGEWLVLGVLAAGCVGDSQAKTRAGRDAAAPAGSAWKLSAVSNLSRLPGLRPSHRELLAQQGFFLVPQDPPPQGEDARPKAEPLSEADPYPIPAPQREQTQATHLFHVYERNDYIRFPSFITVDLAIDTTHAYFDAVLRDIEQHQLGPMLARALAELVEEAEKVRATATTASGRAVAQRTAVFLAAALQLQNARAVIPPALRAAAGKVAKAITKGEAKLPIEILKVNLDLTQIRPRGHYTRSKDLKRFFRAMSLLGMAAFPIEGKYRDIEGVALLARTWLGSKAGREGLERLMKVTTFFAGGADTAGLGEAAAALKHVLPDAENASADALVAPEMLTKLQRELAAAIRPPRIKAWQPDQVAAPRQVRVLGRRAFEDAVAMQELIPALLAFASERNPAKVVAAMMGARGAAAVLGSGVARDLLLADLPAEGRSEAGAGLAKGQASLAAVGADRWSQDAYHGTLDALRTLLDPLPANTPALLATEAWRLRAVQAFASGWAELRHDTVLYGEQSGAECDVEEFEPPPCWVEPVPELYRRLGDMVRELEKRLASAGVKMSFSARVRAAPSLDEPNETITVVPPARKTEILLGFLDELVKVSETELKGGKLDRNTLTWMTTIGGTVEWLLMTFSNSETLNQRDADMAVVADVFTWRPSQQVLEVGIAQPELIYAIIPSPKGPLLARGAVMAYREFMHPQASRMTDEKWRKVIAAGKSPERPDWLAPLYAAPLGPVKMPKVTQSRCSPQSGASLECL